MVKESDAFRAEGGIPSLGRVIQQDYSEKGAT